MPEFSIQNKTWIFEHLKMSKQNPLKGIVLREIGVLSSAGSDLFFILIKINILMFKNLSFAGDSNTFYPVGFCTVRSLFNIVIIYTISFYTVVYHTVTKFMQSLLIRSNFIRVNIYTVQNLNSLGQPIRSWYLSM
jgi:hypothetical protein